MNMISCIIFFKFLILKKNLDIKFFFAEGYLFLNPEVKEELEEQGLTVWEHYVLYGKAMNLGNGLLSSSKTSKELRQKTFFEAGYLELNPDVAVVVNSYSDELLNSSHNSPSYYEALEHDAWHHYVMHGYAEGRNNGITPPKDYFFAEGYLFLNPEVKEDLEEQGLTVWEHYVL